jgi:hypothetical protein
MPIYFHKAIMQRKVGYSRVCGGGEKGVPEII